MEAIFVSTHLLRTRNTTILNQDVPPEYYYGYTDNSNLPNGTKTKLIIIIIFRESFVGFLGKYTDNKNRYVSK